MNTKVKSGKTSEDEGIVYILLIKLEDKDLVKIGVTGRAKVEDRVIEILLGIYRAIFGRQVTYMPKRGNYLIVSS